MKYDKREQEVTLSSGRRFRCYGGQLGISVGSEQDHTASAGMDTWVDGAYPSGDEYDSRAFTPEERQEIAEEMIARWRQWGGLGYGSREVKP